MRKTTKMKIAIFGMIGVSLAAIKVQDEQIKPMNDISIADCILGEKHLMNKIADEKYYVYEKEDTVLNETLFFGDDKDAKKMNRYYDEKLNILYYPETIMVRIISQKEQLDGWTKLGEYVPFKDDQVFLYQYPQEDLAQTDDITYAYDRFILLSYGCRILTGNQDTKEGYKSQYLGILDEVTYEKYKNVIFWDGVSSSLSYITYGTSKTK